MLSTSTVLLNDTLDALLGHCRGAERIALIGRGELPARPLFERGVTLLGGSWIADAEGFKNALLAGTSWSGCARKDRHRARRLAWRRGAAGRAASVQR